MRLFTAFPSLCYPQTFIHTLKPISMLISSGKLSLHPSNFSLLEGPKICCRFHLILREFVHVCYVASVVSDSLRPTPSTVAQPGSSVHGILQARILEWVAMPSSRGSSWPRDQTQVSYISCIGKRVLNHYHHGSQAHWKSPPLYCMW